MHEIFISYSSKQRELTRRLAWAIEAQYGPQSVWWDKALESWVSFERQMRSAAGAAHAMVVIWSEEAAAAEWVKSEAQAAHNSGRLINVIADGFPFEKIPKPYGIHHVKRLSDVRGILASIAAVMASKELKTEIPYGELYFRDHGKPLLDPMQEKLNPNRAEILPSDLLQAKYAAVPFQDAAGAMAECLAWCQGEEQPIAGRLYYGPGGLGKTRLLIEVAAALRDGSWSAGFLDACTFDDEARRKQAWLALEECVLRGEDKGVAIVLDRAEARQPEIAKIAQLLLQPRENASRPVRLILLARSAIWWERLREEHGEIERVFPRTAAQPDAVALSAGATAAGRQALFVESVKKLWPFLQAQGFAKPQGAPSRDRLERISAGEDFERPLAIQMEALLWLCAAPTSGTGIDAQLDAVLGLERAHWARLLGPLDDGARRDLDRGAAQVAALAGTAAEAATEALLMADGYYKGRRTARVDVAPALRNLTRVYGRERGGARPIEPGLLGEHQVAAVADADLIEGCLAWIGAQPEAEREKHRRDLIATLQRATCPEHGATLSARAAGLLDHLILRHMPTLAADLVAVMTDMPGQLQSRIEAALGTLDFDALGALDFALPLRHPQLMELAHLVSARRAALSEARLNKAKAGTVQAAALEAARDSAAAAIGQHGLRLFAIGKHEEAIRATDEALILYRDLAEVRPGAFLPSLATALHNAGPMLSKLGRREDALNAAREALAIWRLLAENPADNRLDDLAGSLSDLGGFLADLGRREEALAASQEAADIYRRLAAPRPDAFLPDLAASLNTLGSRLFHVDRREEALAASLEAADTYRRLAATRRDAVLPGLAASLNSLAQFLSGLGRPQEALAACRETVDIYRKLAGTRPDSFLPDLAAALNTLGTMLSKLGRQEEALTARQEAADIRRQLAEARPDTFLPDLAASLTDIGGDLSNLGRQEEALAASFEAAGVYRRLAAGRPEAFLPYLAIGLTNLGNDLSNLGRRGEALAASQEAVDVYQRLAAANPGAFLPELAKSLHVLGSDLAGAGRQEEALAANQHAADIYRQLAAARPATYLPGLAHCLNILAGSFSGLGRGVEALGTAQEALEIVAPMVERMPEPFSRLAQEIGKTYMAACWAADEEEDWPLLERAMRAAGAMTDALQQRLAASQAAAQEMGEPEEEAPAGPPEDTVEQVLAALAAAEQSTMDEAVEEAPAAAEPAQPSMLAEAPLALESPEEVPLALDATEESATAEAALLLESAEAAEPAALAKAALLAETPEEEPAIPEPADQGAKVEAAPSLEAPEEVSAASEAAEPTALAEPAPPLEAQKAAEPLLLLDIAEEVPEEAAPPLEAPEDVPEPLEELLASLEAASALPLEALEAVPAAPEAADQNAQAQPAPLPETVEEVPAEAAEASEPEEDVLLLEPSQEVPAATAAEQGSPPEAGPAGTAGERQHG